MRSIIRKAMPGAEEGISYKIPTYKLRGGPEPVPVKLIERIAKFRAKEVAGRGKAKAAAPEKR